MNEEDFNYQHLDYTDNKVPTSDSILRPLLYLISETDISSRNELTQKLTTYIQLPDSIANKIYSAENKGRKGLPIFPDRVGFAISDLKLSGLISSPKRSYYQITDLGKQILTQSDIKLSRKYLHTLKPYKEHKAEYKKEKQQKQNNNKQPTSDIKSDKENQTGFPVKLTQKQIADWFYNQRESLSNELLTKLRSVDPYEFEEMMVQLMSTMGYKGADGQAFATKKSNDGGIDGILNQDALGLNKIYIQVKRYGETDVVGRQTISQFHGDLDLQGVNKGVFITTSSFTSGAKEAAKRFNIRLIDGKALTKLMLEYKVGVQNKETYELLEIDNDFFKQNEN